VTAGVSLIIPTLNAGPLLRRCLESIRAQDFTREQLEVMVLDGGSNDGTRELAAELGAEVVDNPLVLAEPGVKLGMARARHDIKVVLAADNALPRPDWLRTIVGVLERTGARGAFTHVVDAPIDSAFCRYFNRLHADPFNWFVFGAAADPRRFGEVYPTLDSGDGYVVYDLHAGDPPLLALAQGFAIRGTLPGGANDRDDMLPLWQLIEAGERFAYVELGILHHTVAGFRDFLRKYRRRVEAALGSNDAAHRQRHSRLSRRQRVRRVLWVPYALTLVAPAVDGVRGLLRQRDPIWLYHLPACAGLALVMSAAALAQIRRALRPAQRS
jgi:glycosyltransferase involved in cell wall biosynthesis